MAVNKQSSPKFVMTFEEKKKFFAEFGIFLAGFLLISYFFGFSYIWNTSYGSEASVNGWNYIIAFFSGTYSSENRIFGDLAVPFNVYAKIHARVLAVMVVVSLFIIIALVVVSALNIKKFKKRFELLSIGLLYFLSLVYLGCIIVGLLMNGSDILSKFCGGNPECSIGTLAFIPFGATVLFAIFSTRFVLKNEL